MTALTDAIRSHFAQCVATGRIDGDGLDVLLDQVEAAQHRAAHLETLDSIQIAGDLDGLRHPVILKGNADLGGMDPREAGHG